MASPSTSEGLLFSITPEGHTLSLRGFSLSGPRHTSVCRGALKATPGLGIIHVTPNGNNDHGGLLGWVGTLNIAPFLFPFKEVYHRYHR